MIRDARSITATRSSHKVQGVLEGCLRGRLSAARSSMISIDRRRLNRELNRLLGPQAMSRAASCGATISVRARDKVLMFLTCRDVEATNNESERALPPLGDLPQLCGAHDYAESAFSRLETMLVFNSLMQ